MLGSESFLGMARERGFRFYSGVPCSYLKPFINYVIDADELRYVGAANEGDAVAIAAGAELGGQRGVVMFQNSGLGNAVNPLTSLAHTARIPMLLIPTLRGEVGGAPDEPQHELMGSITTGMLELMEIPWEPFPEREVEIDGAISRAVAHMDAVGRPYALVMRKGTVEPRELRSKPEVRPRTESAPATPIPEPVATRREMLQAVIATLEESDVAVATTGYTGRELYALADRENHFYMVGSMGCALQPRAGLGPRPAADRRVVVLDGDGAALMRLGAFATVGYERPAQPGPRASWTTAHTSRPVGRRPSRTRSTSPSIAAATGYAQRRSAADSPSGPGPQPAQVRSREAPSSCTCPSCSGSPSRPAAAARGPGPGCGAPARVPGGCLMDRPTILLNPGPVTLTERVRRALLRDDLCHREPEFAELTLDVKRRLAAVYGVESDFEPILLTGSGTGAVEAMLATLVPPPGEKGERCMVVANGVYGERMATMLEAHGREVVQVRSDWLSGIDTDEAERLLASDANISHVVCVHNETTTGRLNDVGALGRVCRQHDRPLLLDCVSSFGGEAIDFVGWNLDALAATANKCLHGVPGISFCMVRKRALAMKRHRAPSVYLDLRRYHETQRDGFSPFTQSVHACFALQEALVELEEQGGWEARNQRYRTLTAHIRAHLEGLGIEALLPPDRSSSMLTAYRLPEGMGYARLHDALKEAGFVIYAGQGDLAKTIFRIATMGDLRDDDVGRLLQALDRLLR